MEGWVKLHRKIIDWGWYSDIPTRLVFIHILLLCTHKEYTHAGIALKPGQCIIGTIHTAKAIGISRQELRTSLTKLKSTSEITTNSTNKFTIVTVVRWDEYQDETKQSTSKSTNKSTNHQPTSNHRTRTKEQKNINNNKAKKKLEPITTLEAFNAKLASGIDNRQKEYPTKNIANEIKLAWLRAEKTDTPIKNAINFFSNWLVPKSRQKEYTEDKEPTKPEEWVHKLKTMGDDAFIAKYGYEKKVQTMESPAFYSTVH